MRHKEGHFGHRVGWLRASVLGANDGIVSTASILLGVAASGAERGALLTAGMAGLVAGSVAMAVGEYVSVASQRDTERSDIAKESWELQNEAEHELDELTAIYTARGLDRDLARQVAVQLTERDALGDGPEFTVHAKVVVNAGAALFIAGGASDLQAAPALAEEAIDSGRALAVLEKLLRRTADPSAAVEKDNRRPLIRGRPCRTSSPAW